MEQLAIAFIAGAFTLASAYIQLKQPPRDLRLLREIEEIRAASPEVQKSQGVKVMISRREKELNRLLTKRSHVDLVNPALRPLYRSLYLITFSVAIVVWIMLLVHFVQKIQLELAERLPVGASTLAIAVAFCLVGIVSLLLWILIVLLSYLIDLTK